LRAIGLALCSTESVIQSSANARGNYGQDLIDAQRQSKSGNDKTLAKLKGRNDLDENGGAIRI
jgi:hypothetical protein